MPKGITLELVESQQTANLARREADLAVRHHPPEGGDLYIAKLGTFAAAVYRRRETDAAAWVTYTEEQAHYPTSRWVQQRLRETDAAVALRASNTPMQLSAIRNGAGRGLLPCFIGDSDATLERLTDPISEIAAEYWVIVHRDLRRAACVGRSSIGCTGVRGTARRVGRRALDFPRHGGEEGDMHRVLITGAGGGIGRSLRETLRGVYPVVRLSDRVPLAPARSSNEGSRKSTRPTSPTWRRSSAWSKGSMALSISAASRARTLGRRSSKATSSGFTMSSKRRGGPASSASSWQRRTMRSGSTALADDRPSRTDPAGQPLRRLESIFRSARQPLRRQARRRVSLHADRQFRH